MKARDFVLILILAIALVIIIIALGGGISSVSNDGPKQQLQLQEDDFILLYDDSGYLWRAVDDEAGVVCWIYRNGYQGGLSCLPLDQTAIER